MADFDQDPPWWVKDGVAGFGGGATGIAIYKAWTGEGRDGGSLVIVLVLAAAFVWYVVAVARWRQAHRVRPDDRR